MSVRRAGIYLRISLDPTGARLGVQRQRKDCEAKARALGWEVVDTYEDNDVSATSAKPRPEYQRLLADLEAGRIDAVVVWDLDRLTRRPIEIEGFIDLADRRHIALASVGGDVDLSTDNGRLFARIKGAVARAEIERKSARQKAASDQHAQMGLPRIGRRPYGYETDAATIREAEAAHLRDAARRLVAGDAVHAIARHLNATGATTATGGPWRPSELRRVLRNPRYAALRVHRGHVIGPATWEPILDYETHSAICAILDDPGRRRPGRPRAWLLSSIATCGTCGAPIQCTRSGDRARYYMCRTRSHVVTQAQPIDDYVTAVLLDVIAAHGQYLLVDERHDAERHRWLIARERELRRKLDGLAEAYAAGDLDEIQLRAGSRCGRAELEGVLVEMAAIQRRPAITGLTCAPDPARHWEAMGMDAQRAAVDAVLRVVIHPPGRGSRAFRPETVDISPRRSSD
mgnify:CR=1 FL=1